MTEEDDVLLRADLAETGAAAFGKWWNENRELAYAYMKATPSQRKRRKAWASPQIRRRLVLISVYKLRHAELLLDHIDDLLLEADQSYRGMAVSAAKACRQLMKTKVPYRP